MGTVYAKESGTELMDYLNPTRDEFYEPQPEEKKIKLDTVRARVDKVHINGLGRTKDDIVKSTVQEIFEASNFEDVLIKAHRVKSKLDSMGCFKEINVLIDVSNGPKATPDGLEVTFHVKEMNRIVGGVNTVVGENEGSVVLGVKMPNIAGRGEKLQAEYSMGYRKNSNFSIALSKPFPTNKYAPVITASLFQQNNQFPWSGYKFLDRGVLLDLAFSSSDIMKHNLQWEGLIRDTSVLSKTASFKVREVSGPQMKSCIRHITTIDTRDDLIFPYSGICVQLINELAGLGGSVAFVKNEMSLQTNYEVAKDIVLQLSGQMGFLHDRYGTDLTEHLYLGGPTNLRGFQQRGAGPHHDGCATGGKVYWASGVHVFTPLPFRPGKGGLGELFRTHFFVNAGCVEESIDTMDLASTRLSCGCGMALKLGGIARIELNYCIPLKAMAHDRKADGFQFGIGIKFL